MDMDRGWEGQDRRRAERRTPCNYPDCGAKSDADKHHQEIRDDLMEIKKINIANGTKFENLAETMVRVIALKDEFDKLDKKHEDDIKEVRTALDKRVTLRELGIYGAIIVFFMGFIQFLVVFLTR
jgi:hypothetical protein